MKKALKSLLILSVFMFYSQTVFCAEDTSGELEPPDEGTAITVVKETVTTSDDETVESKFNDSERLIQTLLGNLVEPDDEGEISDPTLPASPEVPGTDGQLTEAQATAFVEQLSEEQIFALNRSLNNAVSSGLVLEYDMELLEKVAEENYNNQQINALTKALEEQAKFQALYEKTGNEKFLKKAESQKEKFLSKIDKFQDTDLSLTTEELNDAVKSSSKEAAKIAAKEAAKEAAHEAAKDTVKEAAKTAQKESVKEKQAEKITEKAAAKAERDAIKAEKTATRNAAKAEREAARDAAKAEREAARDAAKAEREAARTEKTNQKK